jgi:NAD(P)-dependent dehydrogenase (short-subunit alcohol dehydrogenase family)
MTDHDDETTTMPSTVVVTGGHGGIGESITTLLRRRGIRVVVFDRDTHGSDSIGCDVRSEQSVEDAFAELVERYGRPDGLVCAAGVVSEEAIETTTKMEWDRVVETCLTGTFLSVRAFVRCAPPESSIVAFSSGYATKGYANGASYAAAKAGVEALVKSAALELGHRGFRVNAVAPGPIETGMLEHVRRDPSRFEAVLRAIPLGRVGVADDVAAVVAFLLSGAARYITGQIVHVNGGMLMP